MGIIMIIAGAAIIIAILVIPVVVMVRDLGWKAVLTIWTWVILGTAAVAGAALLIGYGVDRL